MMGDRKLTDYTATSKMDRVEAEECPYCETMHLRLKRYDWEEVREMLWRVHAGKHPDECLAEYDSEKEKGGNQWRA